MTLDDFLLALVAPARLGEEITPGVRLLGTSTELGPRLTLQVGEHEVHVEIAPREPTRPSAAQTSRLALSYRSSTSAPVDSALGVSLCRALVGVIARNEEAALRALRDAAPHGAEAESSAKVREVRVARLLEPAGTPDARYFSVSPYVGCLIGCRFCYAHSHVAVSRTLARLPEVPWGSYVDVRINAAEILAAELSTAPLHPIKFCPIVSDPYQAVERRHRLTRGCLEVVRSEARGRPVLVLTRSAALVDDMELLASMANAWVGFSVPTEDDAVRRHFEPRAASIPERLATLALLRSRGVRTFAVLQPVLSDDVEALASALAEVVDSVSIDVLHGVQGAERDFDDPRFEHMRASSWQAERRAALAQALAARGVGVWAGELPPELRGPR